jgi:hypothetical protein
VAALCVKITTNIENLVARSGGRAVFDSVTDANSFAEQHATLTGAPSLQWEHLGDSLVMCTQFGQYVVGAFSQSPVDMNC